MVVELKFCLVGEWEIENLFELLELYTHKFCERNKMQLKSLHKLRALFIGHFCLGEYRENICFNLQCLHCLVMDRFYFYI